MPLETVPGPRRFPGFQPRPPWAGRLYLREAYGDGDAVDPSLTSAHVTRVPGAVPSIEPESRCTVATIERAVPSDPIPGVEPIEGDSAKWQRRSVLIITLVPFIGFLLAIMALWGRGITFVDAGIALAFYYFTGLGVTIGFHRLFTHQSFVASRPLKIVLAIAGSMALQGSLIDWVAAHRRHHAFSDKTGDPHSPHLDEGEGFTGVIKGLWHAHVGWLVTPERTDLDRWAPDLLKDPDLVRIHRSFPLLTVVTFVMPALIGFAITRSVWGGVTAFLWGALARIFFLHHVTWSINSVCHFYGKRPFRSADHSTNNWLLSIVSFGESWHNNHHAFPSSAVHGIGRGQLDTSGRIIRMFAAIGWIKAIKSVSPKQLAAKVQAPFHPRRSHGGPTSL